MTKIKIPLSEKNRYVDLMGDPIHQNKIASTFLSQEFAASAGASIFAASLNPENAINTAISTFAFNVAGLGIIRFVFDKLSLSSFDKSTALLSRATLGEVCIDKNPSPEEKVQSVFKHGSNARRSSNFYSFFLLINAVNSATQLINPDKAIYALGDIAEHIRCIRGIYRMRKIMSGEWAIVSMPKEQEKIKDYLEFDIPDIKLPEIKQPSPAPTFGRHAPGC